VGLKIPRGVWSRLRVAWQTRRAYWGAWAEDFQSLFPGHASAVNSAALHSVRFRSLHGPATTEIDSPSLRGRRRLNRRVKLILSHESFH